MRYGPRRVRDQIETETKEMVNSEHPKLSVRSQCKILALNRSSYYHQPQGENQENLAIMKRIDEIYLTYPFYGSRRMTYVLKEDGFQLGRHRVRRLMKLMGLQAIYQKPRTSSPNKEHKIYPYRLFRTAEFLA